MADTEKFAMTSFRDMPYHRPDIAAFGEAMKKATEEMQRAESYAQARDIFLSLQEKECEVDTLFSLCSVRNTIDTGDVFYDSEIRALRAEYATLIPLEKAWKEALAGSKFREDFTRE